MTATPLCICSPYVKPLGWVAIGRNAHARIREGEHLMVNMPKKSYPPRSVSSWPIVHMQDLLLCVPNLVCPTCPAHSCQAPAASACPGTSRAQDAATASGGGLALRAASAARAACSALPNTADAIAGSVSSASATPCSHNAPCDESRGIMQITSIPKRTRVQCFKENTSPVQCLCHDLAQPALLYSCFALNMSSN